MKCVALVVLMALVAANAQVIVPSYGYGLAYRGLAGALSYPYGYSYYGARLAYDPIAYTAPAVIPAPIAPVVVAPPALEFGIPKATFTAKTPGSTYTAELPGHFESVVAENLDMAPGTPE